MSYTDYRTRTQHGPLHIDVIASCSLQKIVNGWSKTARIILGEWVGDLFWGTRAQSVSVLTYFGFARSVDFPSFS